MTTTGTSQTSLLETMFGRDPVPNNFVEEKHNVVEDEYSGVGQHTLQRKACLTKPGPVNHGKHVFYVKDDNFDLNRTIFKSVSGLMGFKRLELKNKLGNKFMWDPEAQEQIEKGYEEFEGQLKAVVLKQPSWENYKGLYQFMQDECNFNTEHADGSFMDHLYFCRDYSKAHYPTVSPRILFLHSIMGVGSNLFPMSADKVPKLQGMLLDEEFKQVAAFPSILRLMNQGKLVQELLVALNEGKLEKMMSLSLFRVIDNEPITLTAEEFWVAMNLQVIHQLDFLPCSNWCSQASDPMFQVFTEIHELMTKSEKIVAKVEFDINTLTNAKEKDEFGMPVTVASMLSRRAPKSLKRSAIKKSIEAYSKKINHDMSYKIEWAA